MAVDGNIHHLRIQNPQVGLGGNGFRRPEKDIGKVRGDMHANIVGQSRLQALEDQVDGIGVHTHVGLPHGLRNGGVNTAGLNVAIVKLFHPAFHHGSLQPFAGLVVQLDIIALRQLDYLFQSRGPPCPLRQPQAAGYCSFPILDGIVGGFPSSSSLRA